MYIVDSAALVLAQRHGRTTTAVDALSIDHRGPVLDAARKVAAEHRMPDDWLNDQARWIPVLPALDDRAEVLFESPHFIVTGVFPRHMLAMKVLAARSRDP